MSIEIKINITMIKKLIIIFILAFSLFSCKKDKDGSCETNSGAQIIVHDGLNREYMLYVPTSYNAATPTPVMMNFHGFGGSASEYMNDADMRSLADSEIFILVYPQGSCMEGFSHWNPSLPSADNKSNVDDFGFIEAMINEISSEFNIDTKRIYACGYSNGGMFAYGLANFKSDLFAAVASVSGTMLDFNSPTSHPMPVIHLHGTSDGVIPYNGNNDYNSAQSILDYWIDFNNTITNPTVNSESDGGMTIEHYIYDQGDSSVSVEHYKFIGGDHVWFNVSFQGQNTDQLIWNFVSRYDINGLR